MKHFYVLTVFTFFGLTLSACTSIQHTPKSAKQIQSIRPNAIQSSALSKPTPVSYIVWLERNPNQKRVSDYKNYLISQGVNLVAPDFELFRSARGWQACQYDQYDVPDSSVWNNAVPTLKLLAYLVNSNIISDIELTSAYRSPMLNACVGGAKESSHMQNSAIDFRIGPEFPSDSDQLRITSSKRKLCKFWQTEGQHYNMGLGVYSSGQIHIDTKGFRTWGPDHTWHSSICGEKIE
ncbi:YcbK family protein [Acinetobacter soli]|uniref:YcbK family protein n=1 Tax=Acinetobacter soli TaxID=487316 RepID=UPI00125DAF15|nr:D-Ala-D-Ala carboxypeptidase family metallohydrolase [Acinetobacter soli]